MVTPQTKAINLAAAIGLDADLYLKREDLHPYGSHKGRSIPKMIGKYAADGVKDFVISSSGNAALAAAMAIRARNQNKENKLSLIIFVGENISPNKLCRIYDAAANDDNISVNQVGNPKQEAFLAEKNGRAMNLRQSTDDNALAGYEELADELAEIKNLTAVFIPTSSGTTAQGLYLGLRKSGINAQIHIVQTDSCHPMVESSEPATGEPSLASAIVDITAHRKNEIYKILKISGGAGWIADNKEIIEAMALAKNSEGADISPNSALSIAGLKKAIRSGWKFDGPVVCLITGL